MGVSAHALDRTYEHPKDPPALIRKMDEGTEQVQCRNPTLCYLDHTPPREEGGKIQYVPYPMTIPAAISAHPSLEERTPAPILGIFASTDAVGLIPEAVAVQLWPHAYPLGQQPPPSLAAQVAQP